jgi:LPXTG-site transpeptidase (sortase) family protein
MRPLLVVPVAALTALLVWLFGAPFLGQGGGGHVTSAALPRPSLAAALPGEAAAPVSGAWSAWSSLGRMPSPSDGKAAASPGGVILVIPRLAVRAPVVDRGVNAQGELPIASGFSVTHYTFSARVGERGNYVAYGHDDIQGSVFANLGSLRGGDPIELLQAGRRFLYRVTGTQVVWPSDVAVLRSTSRATMTLITCTPYMVDTQRIVVSASLAGVEGV